MACTSSCGGLHTAMRCAIVLLVLLASTSGTGARPGAEPGATDSPPARHVTYITPIWTRFLSAPEAEVAANVATLRERIGEGGGVKLGFAAYVFLTMDDWHVDISSPTAVRQALGDFESQVDEGIRRARAHNIVFAITLLTATRERTDAAQEESYDEDRRVMQWNANNQVADGWWTHSRYARRQYAVQRAYMQEAAKILADRVAQYPETLVGIAGDGEVELAGALADYSPFAVAEFGDWLRAEGLYAPGAAFAGEAYALAARYHGDVTPAVDSNGDGHTLNQDEGTLFDTWDLRYFAWSLDDSEQEDPNAIPSSAFTSPEFNPLPDAGERFFDPPRIWQQTRVWCQLWNLFRQTMVWHHNRDLARWMTTTADDFGRRLPANRWFSYQIPADYLFGSSPENPTDRLLASASPWWTANVAPYGGLGFTAFGVRFGRNTYQRTLPGLLRGIRPCGPGAPLPPICVDAPEGLAGTPWGIFEWNPVVPLPTGSDGHRLFDERHVPPAERNADAPHTEPDDLTIYRDEIQRLRRYRPTILAPFAWGDPNYRVLDTGFETSMRQFATLLRDGWAPSIQASPMTLHLAVTRRNGSIARSAPQTVFVSQPTGGTVDWRVTANPPWLAFGSGSGHGDGAFTVDVDPAGIAALPAGTHEAVATIAAPGSIQETLAVAVSLTIFDGTPTRAPFGQIDTPAQDATGVTGSIGVTGWVLDDVGISSVKLYRNCLPFEPVENCQSLGGFNVVYIGDADLVHGARPDVEAAYPTYPQVSRAGWGYLMLTNMLPHLPTERMFGGQGTLSIHVFATDVEGNLQRLGRTVFDQIPTTITLANDTIAKPFGAIDTPRQGETVSGAVWNFGWALTPDSDTAAGTGDILVPTTGWSMWVWIDGAPVSRIGYYNLCRGTVGSPVPVGIYCNDDVASIFGNPTPQAIFTPRSANPTQYRNLDAGRGAMAAYSIDTTALGNGRHSIVWGVTDSAGRVDGIGSRSFIVLNAGADAPARAVGDEATLSSWPVRTGPVWGRAGFDVRAPWEILEPDGAGTRHVRMPELGRVELYLGSGVTTGYLAANGTLRPLPTGSQLRNGDFTWAPPVGYLGAYNLVFLDGSERVLVTVTIHGASERSRVVAYIDTPREDGTVRGAFTIAGWAADPAAWHGTGIGTVHVWAHRRDRFDLAPTFLGVATLDGWRPDVAAQYGTQFERAGWSVTVPALPPGDYNVAAYFWSRRTQRFEDSRVVRLSAR